MPLADSYTRYALSAGGPWDYFHVNSIALDPSGDVIVGARNTCAVYRIDRATGKTVWQVGGKRPTFRMGAGTRFYYQHDARLRPDGMLTVFDDEGAPPVQPRSRGIALHFDTAARTATLAGPVFHHPRRLASANQGNMQSLPNGDVLLGWGNRTAMTEFDATGKVVFDAHLPPNDQTSGRTGSRGSGARRGGRPPRRSAARADRRSGAAGTARPRCVRGACSAAAIPRRSSLSRPPRGRASRPACGWPAGVRTSRSRRSTPRGEPSARRASSGAELARERTFAGVPG